MFVLGTAGHVDHGKSTLVHALTGIDPDRLREEKERGMTIDLGFAWLTLPSGREVSIVDVPGHERFIKNMLAGVGGIDLALLIVAADEGVMPQTREHLAILDLLRVSNGIAVITKSDLVDPEWLELVVADVEEMLRPTSLAGAPILTVSAVTGAGLNELKAAIDARLSLHAARADRGRPRLPVDRVFTIAGFGTVVTGTLIDGTFAVGDEVEIVPSGHRSRIRGLQMHRTRIDRALPGSRVAINLAGLATTDLRRGDLVVRPGWLQPTTAFDARIRVLGSLERPLRHNSEVTLHLYSSEVGAKVRLLEADALLPGETGWAQLRTAAPIAATKGDLFVIRSANETLGGGEVVDVHVKRHRRRDPRTIERLAALERGSERDFLVHLVRSREPAEMTEVLKRTPLPPQAAEQALAAAVGSGDIRVLAGRPLGPGTFLMSEAGWRALRDRACEIVANYHRLFPLRAGMPREELRTRLGIGAKMWPDTLAELIATGGVAESGSLVRLPSFAPTLSPAQRNAAERYLAALRASPYAPNAAPPDDPELLSYLVESGQVVRVAENVIFAAEAYRELVEGVVAHLREHGTITVAALRDRFGTSRKFALGLLEHLDERRITRRQGDARVLRDPSANRGERS
ncbi:MAG: selenocysteine-specific translation elongation factor [Chloroflexota bacterium]|nr:selenocysteine-specific translation elongation factor [Dehalococcoidia bacterium]MDW8253496.1 selenocysteine-specific translation elongation factor [Chloroflexota bacterium]